MLTPRKMNIEMKSAELVSRIPAPIRPAIEPKLNDFQARRTDLIQLVREGEMTNKAANARARELAESIQTDLRDQVSQLKSTTPKLSETIRRAEKERSRPKSPEQMQAESIELLRANLIELQITNRRAEFESKTYVKNGANQVAAPSVEKLFDHLNQALRNMDDAAAEWSRRQLEQMRPFVAAPEVAEQIDIATSRPGRLNDRIIDKYRSQLAALATQKPGLVEALLEKAIEVGDANACVAVYETVRANASQFTEKTIESVGNRLVLFPPAAFQQASVIDDKVREIEITEITAFQQETEDFLRQAANLGKIKPLSEKEIEFQQHVENVRNNGGETPIGLVPGNGVSTRQSTS
jgi:hypothetical protein